MSPTENANFTIYVVDDEEIVLSLISDALEEDGFNVMTANSAIDAFDYLKDQPADLLITDIRMPKMNGIELVKKTKELYPNISVIFMTGYANLDSAKDAIKQGATDYIMKPFELNEIRQAVYKAVDQIKKDVKASNSDKQLDRLNDLHQMLFTVGDKKSVITVSLKFALMQYQAHRGAVLYWDSDRTDFNMISLDGDNATEKKIPVTPMTETLNRINLGMFLEPLVVEKIEEHPFYNQNEDCCAAELVLPEWKDQDSPMVIVPISRTYSIYGLMMIDASNIKTSLDENSLKFLTITAHQLAMSLENLELLEESQKAYTKLKEMQDETIQLEKMATRGEMSAELGHELNNFLGVVAGNFSLLEHQLNNGNYDKIDKFMKVINENLEKIKVFTGNLMDLRPISTEKEKIDFNELLNDVIEYLKPQKRFRNVDIKLDTYSSALPIEVDTTHIQQVLYNIFNNAADAMADREKKIIIVTTEVSPDNQKCRLTIRDNGCGIDQEHLNKTFKEKFTTKPNGHGFGLLVCKRIIESHNGQICIDSTIGQGTTVTIEFELCHSLAEEAVLV